MSCVVIRCPPLETVLRSLLEPCHLSVSLDEPELALESLPWAVDFSESLPTTTTDSFSLLNLKRGNIGYKRRTRNIHCPDNRRKPDVLKIAPESKKMFEENISLNKLTFFFFYHQTIILLPSNDLRILFFCFLDAVRYDLYKYLSRKGVDVESVLET